jgi:Holliday junction DNA helicase RuvA
MIGRLKGILLEKTPPQLLLDVNGVAYELHAPMFTFYRIPDIGQEVVLHTHLVVREDAQLLYGFSQERERALFRSLIKVSAVGPKLALAILSGIEPDQFVECILNSDSDSLVRVPGIGRKTAERLLIEMRDRLADWQTTTGSNAVKIPLNAGDKITQDATSALIALGYKPVEARRAVTQIAQDHQTSEELIRHALRGMIKGGVT